MKSTVFWCIAPCSPLKGSALPTTCFPSGFGLFFDPEDGSDMFFRNVSCSFISLHGIVSQKIAIFSQDVLVTVNITFISTFIELFANYRILKIILKIESLPV
jgi:hypothetical protein